MTDRDRPALTGELLSPEQEKLLRALDTVKRQGISTQVSARISRSVFFNRITEKRIQQARAVVVAETDLINSLAAHQKSLNRLLNLGTELEADNLEQQNRLEEARQKAALLKTKGEIEREEAEQYLARLKLNREGNTENTRQQRNDRQYQEAQQQAAHDIRMKALEATKRLEMTKALRQERDRMIAEVTQGNHGQPTPDQQQDIENIRDFFQRLIDEI